MRYPTLPSIVRTYVKAILAKEETTAVVAAAALRRVAAQKPRVPEGLSSLALDHVAALERGDKKGARDTFVSLGKMVGVHVEVNRELRLVEGEGQERPWQERS